MKEYKTHSTVVDYLEVELNEMAQKGWKLVSLTVINASARFVKVFIVLEREKS